MPPTNKAARPARSKKSASASAKSARLAARVTADQKTMLTRAAALSRQPVSQFIISSALRAAEQAIREHDVLVLSARDSLAVMEALLDPAPAGVTLRRVATRYNDFMNQQ